MDHCFAKSPAVSVAAALLLIFSMAALGADEARSGQEIYQAACAACHGDGGQGAPVEQVGFEVPLPDFTDCRFASREPSADWVAVTHEGGTVRKFSRLMPKFGEALTVAEIRKSIDHIRGFCEDEDWPRGEFNLPRALVTTKAFPEDEAVITTEVALEGRGTFVNELLYEKRFGARNQFEVALPIGAREQGPANGGDWKSGVGDLVVGLKRVVYDDLDTGAIVSVLGELSLPTGDGNEGFGNDTTVFETGVAYGQLLPGDYFLQAQAGVGFPFDPDKAEEEAFLRGVVGRSFTSGRWGRVWSPMVEILGARELRSGADSEWDVAPQMQVTLSTRQHVMLNVGLRVPVSNTGSRDTRLMAYLLWDWFDGGFLEGW